jgi:ribosome assembly protein 1
MGHVDHGKSSYADSLLAANSIISARQAGKLRYLDSREDEQERGITMESSAVSLSYKVRQMQSDGTPGEIQDFMINLIDTPGHVDFSSEVSTASRLCDGTLIIVDVVEGVCTQTITVLRQAWDERLSPILVLNKMDRLVTDLKLSPNEAFHHLTQLIEQVNAVMGSFFSIERMEDDQRWHEEREKRLQKKKDAQDEQIVKDLSNGNGGEKQAEDGEEAEEEKYQELNDEDIYFDPGRGNVIFASAIDNWAFRLGRFSHLYSKKLGIQERKFRKVLWGDFYFDPKAKRIIGQKQKEKDGRILKPVFVQFVLENIWSVYESAANRDQDKLEKIVKTLDLKVHPRDLKSKDTATLVQSIFSQWLPLASCTFSALVSNTPPPSKAQSVRIPKMLHPELNYFGKVEPRTALEKDLFDAKIGSGTRRCAYVSKMFAIRRGDLPEGKRKELSAEDMRQRGKEARERAQAVQAALKATGASVDDTSSHEVPLPQEDREKEVQVKRAPEELTEEEKAQEVVLGFSRLYSGTLRVGHSIAALLPKYNPAHPPSHSSNVNHYRLVTIEGLYMMMGRDLIAVSEVPAGNIFAIRGLEGIVLRNATLCGLEEGVSAQQEDYVNLAGVNKMSSPIVRVALEPKNPSHMPKLVEGLRLLNQADPCVETMVQSTGEHVIVCAGEIHLERCLKDLRERFAKCAIQASQPLVPFRETAIRGVEMAPPKSEGLPRGTVEALVSGGAVKYRVRAVPLPASISEFLLINARTIRRLLQRDRQNDSTAAADEEEEEDAQAQGSGQSREVKMDAFWEKLGQVMEKSGSQWKGLVDHIWTMGPKKVGPNLLIDARGTSASHSLRKRTEAMIHRHRDGSVKGDVDSELTEKFAAVAMEDEGAAALGQGRGMSEVEEAIDTGFQLATLQGPMCAEPMQGMAFFVESVEMPKNEKEEGASFSQVNISQLTSALIASTRESCRNGLLDWSPRLMLAMYSCDIQASTDVLGKVHAVLSRRRGRIISEEMKEGTSFFTVGSLLPVIESFGFSDGEAAAGESREVGIYSKLEMLIFSCTHHSPCRNSEEDVWRGESSTGL